MKYLVVILICLMALTCFAQEPIRHEVPIILMLTDAEQKAILHYNKTIEIFVQRLAEYNARTYMKLLADEYRVEDLEIIINSLDIKTLVEIEAKIKEKEVEPIEPIM